ncbi:MAG: hypothetical protein GY874_01135 [Desulfobacteraceae bacterium]|nr:hypothetical protein [Desulfobacteraceae bacterium]
MNSLLKANRKKRYYLFKSTAGGVLPVIFITALTALLIFWSLVKVSSSKTIDIRVKLYNLCESPYTQLSMDFDLYKKYEITFTTKDPNFTMLKNARYTGIPLPKLLSGSACITPDNLNFIILANDQYVLFDALDKSGGIFSYELNSKPIPLKYGGPLKVVYRNFPSQEAAIWHASSIVLGTLEKPALRLITEKGKTIFYDIDRLKTIKNKLRRIPFILPRGYRIKKSMTKSINVRYLPFSQLLQADNINNTYFTMDTYTGHSFEINKQTHLKQLYLVFQFNEKNIPIQRGGPFILAFKHKFSDLFADMQPYYFIHTIRMQKGPNRP